MDQTDQVFLIEKELVVGSSQTKVKAGMWNMLKEEINEFNYVFSKVTFEFSKKQKLVLKNIFTHKQLGKIRDLSIFCPEIQEIDLNRSKDFLPCDTLKDLEDISMSFDRIKLTKELAEYIVNLLKSTREASKLYLSLEGVEAEDEAFEIIFNYIAQTNKSTIALCLGRNKVSERLVRKLITSLAQIKNLAHLVLMLENTQLNNDSLKVLADGLKKLELKSLNINFTFGNPIDKEGASAFVNILKANGENISWSLQNLDILDWNFGETVPKILTWSQGQNNERLESLSVAKQDKMIDTQKGDSYNFAGNSTYESNSGLNDREDEREDAREKCKPLPTEKVTVDHKCRKKFLKPLFEVYVITLSQDYQDYSCIINSPL